jgi:hypothetical protein
MAKIVSQEKKSKIAAKNIDGVTFFSSKHSNETPSSGLYRNIFLGQIGCKLTSAPKNQTKHFEESQNGRKIQNGAKNQWFAYSKRLFTI